MGLSTNENDDSSGSRRQVEACGTGAPLSYASDYVTLEDEPSEVVLPSPTVTQGGQGRKWKVTRRTGSEPLDTSTIHISSGGNLKQPNDSLLELYSSDLNNEVSKKRSIPMDMEGEESTEIVAGSTERALGVR